MSKIFHLSTPAVSQIAAPANEVLCRGYSHGTHDVCPVSDWYVPVGHRVHLMLPVVLLKVPGAQSVQLAAPEPE